MIKSTDWLTKNIDLLDLVILDASLPAKKKRRVQIQGARFFDLKLAFSDASSKYPNTMPTEVQFQSEARKLGVSNDSTIVIYDNTGLYSAARAWYMFKSMGHKEVYVLDGGLPEWIKEGGPTEGITISEYEEGNFEAHFVKDSFCNIDLVNKNLEEKEFQVLDARSAGRFAGTAPEPRKEILSGHIPGSQSLPFTEVLENGKFKKADELAEMFNDTQPIIFTCGSGVTACILFLASEIAGINTNKVVYDGSWTEWALKNELMA